MKIEIYTMLVMLSAILGCSKKNVLECENPTHSITYTELNPAIQLTSVDTLIQHISGCGLIPQPYDSTASSSFDINHDGVDDFTLSCSTFDPPYFSTSNPCSNFSYTIWLSGTTGANKVSKIGDNAQRYVLNEVIYTPRQWANIGMLKVHAWPAPYSDFNGTAYLGLKITTNEGDYFGWMYVEKNGHDIKVISYALNNSVNCPIKAGQTE